MKPWEMKRHDDWLWHAFEAWAKCDAWVCRWLRKRGWIK